MNGGRFLLYSILGHQVLRAGDDGDAFIGAIGAGGEIADGETCGGGGEYGARRSHAIKQAEDFELRLELVGHAVDGEIGLAHSIFNGGDEGYGRQSLRAELAAQGFARVVKISGHYVFKQNAIAGARRREGKPPAEWTCPNNRNGEQGKSYLALSACRTSSALGLDCRR